MLSVFDSGVRELAINTILTPTCFHDLLFLTAAASNSTSSTVPVQLLSIQCNLLGIKNSG